MNYQIPRWSACILSGFFLALTFSNRAFSQTTPPAEPTENTEVLDLSKPPIRSLRASVSSKNPSWNEQRQRVEGAALSVNFNGPAAPLDQVGKTVDLGAISITPEVAGEWKWEKADSLEFFPTAGWLPPGSYDFKAEKGLLADDCEIRENSTFNRVWRARSLTALFKDRTYYIDPATPDQQQLVTTVEFSQPVSLEEAQDHYSVTSVTGIEIFEAGSESQILADPRNPLRFYLHSPLMKPGDKEDLVLFSFSSGLQAESGGEPTAKNLETKLTAYSKDSAFFVESVGNMLRRNSDGEPEQSIFVELSIPAETASVANAVEAWKLPEEARDKNGNIIKWTNEKVTDEVLAESEKLAIERITVADSPPMETIIAFRVPSQPGGKVLVKVAGNTAGPGGFITAEDFRDVTALPPIPKEAALVGNGGLMALNGERKLNVQSRGLDHLRYTVARVQTGQLNHLVSQTQGSFESPQFRGGFGFESISNYQQSVQPIVKSSEYSVNYSSFDFSPLIQAVQPGANPEHGLFHLTVEGVRPRSSEDGAAPEGSTDADWIAIPFNRNSDYSYRHESGSSYPQGDQTRDQRFILVTDLGLIMKESADGSRYIYVQSFSQRGPVEGVEISVLSRNGTVLKNAVTNEIGKSGNSFVARPAAGTGTGGLGGEKRRRSRLHSLGEK